MADNAATMADTPTAELTDETAVTGPGGETAVTGPGGETAVAGPGGETAVAGPGGDLADDVLVEEVSIDGMCGVY